MKPICVVSCITHCHGHGQKLPLSLKRKHLECKKKHWQTEMPSVTHVPDKHSPYLPVWSRTKQKDGNGDFLLWMSMGLRYWSFGPCKIAKRQTPAIWEYSPTAKWYHQICIIRKNPLDLKRLHTKLKPRAVFPSMIVISSWTWDLWPQHKALWHWLFFNW